MKLKSFILKVPTVTLYAARPVGLIYYSNEFHVMDLKVTNYLKK